ncbi:hypothetical protein VdG1_02617 [Verticillium dahliae VDG1]|nr:hypothetical protein VdG1_02617 [Verticillium dahliae VDG1]
MANSSSTEKLALHKRRLLCDFAELQEQPYPPIQLHVDESNTLKVCLVLTPPGWIPIHLTVMFPPEYPLRAPRIYTDTQISHPYVIGSYLCASILNTAADWTPAYTLKGVAIQMLSFFTSETLEQVYGGRTHLAQMPAEILLTIIDTLEFRDLTAFAQAWTRVSDLIVQGDVVRLRELQCFFTKANFNCAKLGVEGFRKLDIRQSVHGISFNHWLPLPIS